MKTLAYSFYGLNDSVQRIVGGLLPVALLLGRLYVAWVFFKAGLTKIDDWGTTLFLFDFSAIDFSFESFTCAAASVTYHTANERLH